MAAGNTYVPIATNTLSSAALTVTFSSIPSTYTDLIIVINGRSTYAGTYINNYLQFNGDGSSNYSDTTLYGNGSSVTSSRHSSVSNPQCGVIPAANITSGIFGVVTHHIMNYANTSTYKTFLNRSSNSDSGGGYAYASVGLWRSTAAITSVVLAIDSGYNWASGSTFSLYGIAAA